MSPQPPIIVLTRDPAGNRAWAAGLGRAGFTVLSVPMIETAPLNVALPDLSSYDWIVLTSPRAAPYLRALINKIKLNQVKIPAIAAVGPATATAAIEAGWEVKFQPRPATAAALGQQLEPVNGRRILVARSSLAGQRLAVALQKRAATVTDLQVYETRPRTVPDPGLDQCLASTKPLALILASPSAVRAITALHPSAVQHPTVTLGPTTTAAARAAGFTTIRQAAAPNVFSLISALKLL